MNRFRGVKKAIINGLWTLCFCGAVLAILQTANIANWGDVWLYAKTKGNEIKECYLDGNCSVDIPIDGEQSDKGIIWGDNDNKDNSNIDTTPITDEELEYKGPEYGESFIIQASKITKEQASKILDTLNLGNELEVNYNRSEWKHWAPIGQSCWTTRKQVLYNQSVPNTVTLIDKNKKTTEDLNLACGIVNGEWIDPYSGEILKDQSKIDIDHVVPLSYASRHGGQEWSPELKEQFANDISVNLLATSATENRKKGDKGPSEYMPANNDYHCAYAKNWIIIINKYTLTITEKDSKALNKALNTCKK